MKRLNLLFAFVLAFVITVTARATAQDTRTVTQPTIPTVCSGHGAEISVSNGDLASESHTDTARIQAALNSCPAGQAVWLAVSGSFNAFLIGPITIPSGVFLFVDSGVTVFASRNPRDYDVTSGSCGVVASTNTGCKPLISVTSSTGGGIVGAGTINGRGGDTLTGVTPSTTWWQLSTTASSEGLAQNNPILVNVRNATNWTLYQIHFVNAPIAHVVFNNGNGYTVWGITINTPFNAQNTDGLDIGNSQNVTVTQSTVSDGDDNVAIGSSGSVGASAAASHYSITNNHFFAGHGVSIGSITEAGVSNILVDSDSFSGNTSDGNSTGMRIKSAADRGGLVTNITYSNICMQNNNHPLQLNPHYNTNTGTLIPNFTNLTFKNVHVLTAGKVEVEGYDGSHKTTVTFDNVVFDSLPGSDFTPATAEATITLGPDPVSANFIAGLTGTGVTVTNHVTTTTAARSCPSSAFGTAP
jgi:polygalacturonase